MIPVDTPTPPHNIIYREKLLYELLNLIKPSTNIIESKQSHSIIHYNVIQRRKTIESTQY